MTLVVAGSLGYDYFLQSSEDLHTTCAPMMAQKEGDLPIVELSSLERSYGGNGGNIAWNLSLLGMPTYLVSALGNNGDNYLTRLQNAGIPTEGITVLQDTLCTTVFFVADDNDHQIAFFFADASHRREWNEDLLPGDTSILHIAPAPADLALSMLHTARKNNLQSIFDPGQELETYKAEQMKECIELSDIFITNEHEYEVCCERIQIAGDQLLDLCPTIIITKSDRGSTILKKGEAQIYVDPCKGTQVVSAVGAGDAFRAGILFAMQKDMSIEEGAKIGSALASLVVAQKETQLATLDLQILDKLLEIQYGFTVPIIL